MLGTEPDGMTLAIMASIYARRAKEVTRDGIAQFAMYAFFDAMERTAIAFNNVLDGKRTTREAYDDLVDYAIRLSDYLEKPDDDEE